MNGRSTIALAAMVTALGMMRYSPEPNAPPPGRGQAPANLRTWRRRDTGATVQAFQMPTWDYDVARWFYMETGVRMTQRNGVILMGDEPVGPGQWILLLPSGPRLVYASVLEADFDKVE